MVDVMISYIRIVAAHFFNILMLGNHKRRTVAEVPQSRVRRMTSMESSTIQNR
jgi:hypothetical protein